MKHDQKYSPRSRKLHERCGKKELFHSRLSDVPTQANIHFTGGIIILSTIYLESTGKVPPRFPRPPQCPQQPGLGQAAAKSLEANPATHPSEPSPSAFYSMQQQEAGSEAQLELEPTHSNLECMCPSGIPSTAPNIYPDGLVL